MALFRVSSFCTILFFLGVTGICHANDERPKKTLSDSQRLTEGVETWKVAKRKCKGNYSYEVHWTNFAGFGHTTTITVKNNQVVERSFKAFHNLRNANGPLTDITEVWKETGRAIGTNKKGAPAQTLDQIYAQGKKVVEKKLESHERRYIRFNDVGLPLVCFYVDSRIADDAPRTGFQISKIRLDLPKK